jgi:hypothetical protein
VWEKPIKVAGRALTGLSCASSSFCAATSNEYVFTSTAPAGKAARWKAHEADRPIGIAAPNAMTNISCPSQALCVASDHASDVIVSSNPLAAGGGSWEQEQLPTSGGGAFQFVLSVTCASVSLCVMGDADGDVYVSRDPASGPASWAENQIDNAYVVCDAGSQSPTQTCPAQIDAIACPSIGLCVALDSTGQVLTTFSPAGGADSWHAARIADWTADPGIGQVYAQISCPSRSFCAVVGDPTGQVFTSTDPAGGTSAWHATTIGDKYVQAISCASSKLCVAVDSKGYAITSTNPAATHPRWTRTKIDRAAAASNPWYAPVAFGLTGIACLSTKLCVAVDGYGNELIARPQIRK